MLLLLLLTTALNAQRGRGRGASKEVCDERCSEGFVAAGGCDNKNAKTMSSYLPQGCTFDDCGRALQHACEPLMATGPGNYGGSGKGKGGGPARPMGTAKRSRPRGRARGRGMSEESVGRPDMMMLANEQAVGAGCCQDYGSLVGACRELDGGKCSGYMDYFGNMKYCYKSDWGCDYGFGNDCKVCACVDQDAEAAAYFQNGGMTEIQGCSSVKSESYCSVAAAKKYCRQTCGYCSEQSVGRPDMMQDSVYTEKAVGELGDFCNTNYNCDSENCINSKCAPYGNARPSRPLGAKRYYGEECVGNYYCESNNCYQGKCGYDHNGDSNGNFYDPNSGPSRYYGRHNELEATNMMAAAEETHTTSMPMAVKILSAFGLTVTLYGSCKYYFGKN